MAGIFDKSISQFKDLLDYRVFRQSVISGNVANMDTPGYKAKEVSFEKELESNLKMNVTNTRHINSSGNRPGFRVEEDAYSRIGNDSNTVDIDREMMKLSQNQLLFNATSQALAKKLSGLAETIRGIG